MREVNWSDWSEISPLPVCWCHCASGASYSSQESAMCFHVINLIPRIKTVFLSDLFFSPYVSRGRWWGWCMYGRCVGTRRSWTPVQPGGSWTSLPPVQSKSSRRGRMDTGTKGDVGHTGERLHTLPHVVEHLRGDETVFSHCMVSPRGCLWICKYSSTHKYGFKVPAYWY